MRGQSRRSRVGGGLGGPLRGLPQESIAPAKPALESRRGPRRPPPRPPPGIDCAGKAGARTRNSSRAPCRRSSADSPGAPCRRSSADSPGAPCRRSSADSPGAPCRRSSADSPGAPCRRSSAEFFTRSVPALERGLSRRSVPALERGLSRRSAPTLERILHRLEARAWSGTHRHLSAREICGATVRLKRSRRTRHSYRWGWFELGERGKFSVRGWSDPLTATGRPRASAESFHGRREAVSGVSAVPARRCRRAPLAWGSGRSADTKGPGCAQVSRRASRAARDEGRAPRPCVGRDSGGRCRPEELRSGNSARSRRPPAIAEIHRDGAPPRLPVRRGAGSHATRRQRAAAVAGGRTRARAGAASRLPGARARGRAADRIGHRRAGNREDHARGDVRARGGAR